MRIIGHKLIPYDNLYHICDIDDIVHTPSNSLLYLEFNERNIDIIEHCRINTLPFALKVRTLKEVVFAANLNAAAVIVNESLAKEAQRLAERYIFDMKIFVPINDDSKIEHFASEGIDGVIFPEAIIKVN